MTSVDLDVDGDADDIFSMRDHSIHVRHEAPFDFGRNWADYARGISIREVSRAEAGLHRLGLANLSGKSFIDIGCGSGIHALAAARQGADVEAIDVDRASVQTTNVTMAKWGHSTAALQISVLDPDLTSLGKFDIVYSWGVLHHTGDVWAAIDRAAALVKPGGELVMGLYEQTRLCHLWRVEKRLYCRSPKLLRSIIRRFFGLALLTRHSIAQRRYPSAVVRSYVQGRGMSFWHDVEDWLGGHPYQSTRSVDVVAYVSKLGFFSEHISRCQSGWGFFGAGCSEYRFRRHS